MEKTYVIYKATNIINGKVYVGKTYNFEKRKREHIYDIDNDLPFHKALKKYGVDSFKWEIIDYASTDEEIREKEIFWIKELNTCIHSPNSNGYNITLGGEGGVSWNSRPVAQFSLEGVYIDTFISVASASILLGLDRKTILDAANGKYAQGCGYLWKYKDEWDGNSLPSYIKPDSKLKKTIIQLDMDGNFIREYESVLEASKILGIGRSNISNCLIGNTRRCGGYQWIYSSDYNPNIDYHFRGIQRGNGILQLDDDFTIINHFANCSEAARGIGEETSVHKLIHSRLSDNKRCRGYFWRKYDDYKKGIRLWPDKDAERISIKELMDTYYSLRRIKGYPRKQGVYMVRIPNGMQLSFKNQPDINTKLGTFTVEELDERYNKLKEYNDIDNDIIYIGASENLYVSIQQLISFRIGYNDIHSDGRALWQICDNELLEVDYIKCDNAEDIINDYRYRHGGLLPLANIN